MPRGQGVTLTLCPRYPASEPAARPWMPGGLCFLHLSGVLRLSARVPSPKLKPFHSSPSTVCRRAKAPGGQARNLTQQFSLPSPRLLPPAVRLFPPRLRLFRRFGPPQRRSVSLPRAHSCPTARPPARQQAARQDAAPATGSRPSSRGSPQSAGGHRTSRSFRKYPPRCPWGRKRRQRRGSRRGPVSICRHIPIRANGAIRPRRGGTRGCARAPPK